MKQLRPSQQELFKTSTENLEWLSQHYEDLKIRYDNQWIIIKDKKIVGSSGSFDQIMNTAKKYSPSEIIVEYMQSEQIAMFF
jgi:hypothetical protein